MEFKGAYAAATQVDHLQRTQLSVLREEVAIAQRAFYASTGCRQ